MLSEPLRDQAPHAAVHGAPLGSVLSVDGSRAVVRLPVPNASVPEDARVGVGKSSGVALILREILDARPDLRIFLIDPHNEYARGFADRANVLTPSNLKLPFWLFSFEEIVDVFFRGRPGVDEEVAILSELI